MPSRRWLAVPAAVAGGALIAAVLAAVGTGPDESDRVAPTAPPPPSSAGTACDHYVAPDGSNRGPGSSSRPWRSIDASLTRLAEGDTLCVRGGRYEENVGVSTGTAGDAPAGVRLIGQRDRGEPPVIRGEFSVVDPDWWTISGLTFTNPSPPARQERIVSILGGTGWVFEDNEVVDGPYAGILVGASEEAGPPEDYVIRGNVVHHTGAAGLYLNPSRFSTGGLVERNLFFDSGTENVKLGWGGDRPCSGRNFTQFGIGEVTFRYNTLHDAERGALIIAEPGGRHSVDVYGNLLTGQPDHLVRYDSVAGCLGDRITVRDNAGGLAPTFSEDFGDSPENVAHERGNVFPVDPEYRSVGRDRLQPTNPEVEQFGRYRSDE